MAIQIKKITKLNLHDSLPLTCTRIGTCCHGNQVLLNPWELFRIAKEKKITPRQFRDLYCDLGGIRLEFNAKKDSRGKSACSQYVDGFGCSVHLGRPLACRLFPLGRQVQNNEVHYIHQGETFPCLNGCAEVVNLPLISVGDYLEGQQTEIHEKVQGDYLEIMQNLADIGFELILDSGLAESGDTKTLALWRVMANEDPELLAARLGDEWMDLLLIPEIADVDAVAFTQKHNELLQLKAQEQFGELATLQECHEASVLIMGVAIHLARAMGTNTEDLAEHWIDIAKSHGAQE
jgi:Fe-S-cluster containining protein